MSEIHIKKIEPFTTEWFDPKGSSIGFLNLFEMTDLRIQVKKTQVEGYHTFFEGKKIFIRKDGHLSQEDTVELPLGFYDLYPNQMFELF